MAPTEGTGFNYERMIAMDLAELFVDLAGCLPNSSGKVCHLLVAFNQSRFDLPSSQGQGHLSSLPGSFLLLGMVLQYNQQSVAKSRVQLSVSCVSSSSSIYFVITCDHPR